MKRKLIRTSSIILATMLFAAVLSVSPGALAETNPKSTITLGDESVSYSSVTDTKSASASGTGRVKDGKLPTVGSMTELLRMLNEAGSLGKLSSPVKSQGGELLYTTQETTVSATPAESPAANDTSYSGTNNQVYGIEEGDIVKTDGKYIYYGVNNQIAIVETDGAQLTRRSLIKLGDNSFLSEIYVSGDHLLVVSQRNEDNVGGVVPYNIWRPTKSYTVYSVYDISDRSKPKQVRAVEAEGTQLAARLVGSTLYFVTNKWVYGATFDILEPADILPLYREIGGGEEKETLVTPDKIMYFPGSKNANYMIVGNFDITQNQPVEPSVYLGAGSCFYMSGEAIYIVCPVWETDKISSDIYKLTIDDGRVDYAATGHVDGQPINQYCMDEWEDSFRIATTDFAGNNSVFVLDKDMKTIGSLTGIAEGEHIQSTRFLGSFAYVVTFKNIDPLFAIDLKDPKNPEILGELKIPGFSQYLHPLGDGLLLGFGRHTQELYVKDENGVEQVVGNRDSGMKLSLFDVSDPVKPTELHKLIISGQGTYSEAFSNPRAIMADAKRGIFGFPVEVYDWDENGLPKVDNWSGCMLISVDIQSGISAVSKLKGDAIADGSSSFYYSGKRVLYIGDTLYMAANGKLTCYSFKNFKALDSTKLLFE